MLKSVVVDGNNINLFKGFEPKLFVGEGGKGHKTELVAF